MDARLEAEKVLKAYGGEVPRVLSVLESQLNTLYARAQVLVSLGGAVVTVTGFSGRIIAATNHTAQFFIIAGLSMVIFAAVWIYKMVMDIRWITTFLDRSPEEAILQIIYRRNRKTKSFKVGGILLFLGMILYGIAVSIMLANPEPLTIAPR